MKKYQLLKYWNKNVIPKIVDYCRNYKNYEYEMYFA